MSPRLITTAVALIGALVVPAAFAEVFDQGTAGKIHYRAKGVALGPTPSQTLQVRCPAGTSVAGGGMGLGFSDAAAIVIAPFNGGDGDEVKDDGWRWSFRASTGVGDGVSVYAACSERSLRYESTARRKLLPGGKTATVTARCAPSQHVTGGGVAVTGRPGDAEVNSSYPIDLGDADSNPDDGWRARVLSTDGDPRKMRAHAICQSRRVVYATATEELNPGSGRTAGAECPSDRHAIGSGARLSGPADTGELGGLGTFDDATDPDDVPDDDGYAYGTNEVGAPGPKTLTGFVVCD